MSHDERPVGPDDAAPVQEEAAAPSLEVPGAPEHDGAPAAADEHPVTHEPATAQDEDSAPLEASAEEQDTTEQQDAAPPEDSVAEREAAPEDSSAVKQVEHDGTAPEDAGPDGADGATEEPAAGEDAPSAEAAPEATAEPEATPADTVAEADQEAAPADAVVEAVTGAAEEEAAPSDTDGGAGSATEAPQDASQAAPTPRPRPVPRPSSRPAAPTPAAVAPAVSAPAAPVPPALTPAETAEAARWGRVDDDGTVWVREESGERVVGQYPDADPTEALAFYVRRYADLHAKVVLFEARLAATDLSVKEIDTTLTHLGEELAEPAAVGDLASLRERLGALRAVAAERRAAAEAERTAAREAALAERTAIVEAAEKIAATDPERMQWRPAGEQLRTLLDRWKEAQRHGPRLDRGTEDALWKRFSHARSAFDRERRRWFSELEKRNAGAKAAKEALVAEAERLSSSSDWGATSAAYRDLMTRWKAAGRASRKDDDALWARFRAAQDVFFAARDASQRQTDAEFSANLEVKLGLLEEAERLVPVTDLAAAKAALRDIQERWERAGKVPRGDVQRVEGRLRAVEQAVRDADQAQWRRTNPETRARAEGAAAQLYAAITALEADLDAAKATGDARKVAEAQAALDARRAWLEQVERAAEEARG